jgi:formylmethanofuran dehydrogenase subunit E
MDLPDELERLAAFHGHLGPYVTIGLRMGLLGREVLGPYKGLRAAVTCPSAPPALCVVDGVQVGSQCTLGKGNITVRDGPNPEVLFSKGGRRLRVALKAGLRARIDREMAKEREVEQSLYYWNLPMEALFDVAPVQAATATTRERGLKTQNPSPTRSRRPSGSRPK